MHRFAISVCTDHTDESTALLSTGDPIKILLANMSTVKVQKSEVIKEHSCCFLLIQALLTLLNAG